MSRSHPLQPVMSFQERVELLELAEEAIINSQLTVGQIKSIIEVSSKLSLHGLNPFRILILRWSRIV